MKIEDFDIDHNYAAILSSILDERRIFKDNDRKEKLFKMEIDRIDKKIDNILYGR